MTPKVIRNTHFSLLGFLGISTIGGGSVLIISPSGELLGELPLSILERSPFNDFLIPGIILFLVLGVSRFLLFGL